MRKRTIILLLIFICTACKQQRMSGDDKKKIYNEAYDLILNNDSKGALSLMEIKIPKKDRDFGYYLIHGIYTRAMNSEIFSGWALKDLQQAYKMEKNNFGINYYMGLCYYSMEYYADALKWYKKAEKLYKNHNEPTFYYDFANAYIGVGDFANALKYNELSFKSEALTGAMYIQKGIILSCNKDKMVLDDNYKKAKKMDANDLWIDHQYAWQLVMLGYYDEAEKMYNKFIVEDDKNNWAYTELGYAAMLQGKWKDAFVLLKKAEMLNYGYKECLRYLSFYYFFYEKNYSQAYDYGGTERLMNSPETIVYEWKNPESYLRYYKNNKYFQKLLQLYPAN